MDALLQVKNLNVRLDNNFIIKNLSLEVARGDILAIVGPNGAGKTTLFKALLGVISYTGEINWPRHIKIGYVPQQLAIAKDLPLSVMEFLSFKNVSKEEILEAVEAVGIPLEHHILGMKLGQLSGGELQRILIAYAMIGHPDILLFDEPTTGIDIGGEETIYTLLEKLHKEQQLTILLISHDLNIIYRYANNVLCLNKEMVCYGHPEEALTSEAIKKLYGSRVSLYQHKHD